MNDIGFKRIIRNASALLTFQVSNYLIPLISIPYLVRVLGIEAFGQWMFALAFIVFARVFVAYGFDLTAAREVALASRDKIRQSELLFDVTVCRLFIWVVFSLVLIILSLWIPQISEVGVLCLIGLLIVLGEVLTPVWLFHGNEQLGTITSLRLVSKFLNLGLLLIFVRAPEDVVLVPALEAGISLVVGGLSLTLGIVKFDVSMPSLSTRRIVLQLRDGSAVFMSTLAVQFYTTAHTVILGLVVGSAAVSAYAIAEKIYSAIRGLLNPLVQAVYPVMARIHGASSSDFSRVYNRALMLLVPILLLASGTLYFLSPWLVNVVAGQSDTETLRSLRVFALSFPFAVGGFLSPMLIVRGGAKQLMWISISSAAIGFLAALPLVTLHGAPGAAMAFLLVQVVTACTLYWVNRRLGSRNRSEQIHSNDSCREI